VILQIDVTVTGPDGVATGSTAVTVNEAAPPAAGEAELSALRAAQRAQARRGANPA
jgi:hypothetical protein